MSNWWPQFDDIQEWLVGKGFASRDWGLLGSALDRPLTTLAGQEMYPTIWTKVAALLDSIERNHPLIDGNKRLGLLLASLVLRANGVDDQAATDDQWYDLIMAVASDHLDVIETATRLEEMLGVTG